MTTDAAAHWLHGTWQLLRHEAPLEFQPRTRMRFGLEHRLTYSIPTEGGVLELRMRWAMDGDRLTTTHDDGSHPVAVQVRRGAGDVLEVDFGGPRAWFVRAAAAPLLADPSPTGNI